MPCTPDFYNPVQLHISLVRFCSFGHRKEVRISSWIKMKGLSNSTKCNEMKLDSFVESGFIDRNAPSGDLHVKLFDTYSHTPILILYIKSFRQKCGFYQNWLSFPKELVQFSISGFRFITTTEKVFFLSHSLIMHK